MPTAKQNGMIWMNNVFGADIAEAVGQTPIPKKLVIAIGIQETFYLWAGLYKTTTPESVLEICVGDTIDYPRRATAWPKDRAELEAHPRGKEMFVIARAALEKVAAVSADYKKATGNPDKFCHGFGMFQYDIQFFKIDPEYFLAGGWKTWKGTLGKGVAELKAQLHALYGPNKQQLTYEESVFLAIAYNQGAKKTKANMLTKRFRQGHKDADGVFYGEHIDHNLKAMDGLF